MMRRRRTRRTRRRRLRRRSKQHVALLSCYRVGSEDCMYHPVSHLRTYPHPRDGRSCLYPYLKLARLLVSATSTFELRAGSAPRLTSASRAPYRAATAGRHGRDNVVRRSTCCRYVAARLTSSANAGARREASSCCGYARPTLKSRSPPGRRRRC